jgi:hypothetical protein
VLLGDSEGHVVESEMLSLRVAWCRTDRRYVLLVLRLRVTRKDVEWIIDSLTMNECVRSCDVGGRILSRTSVKAANKLTVNAK